MNDGTLRLNQIELVGAILKEICRQSGNPNFGCRHDQVNAVIDAANGILESVAVKTVHSFPGEGLWKWENSHDTGMSSKAMAYRMYGPHWRNNWDGEESERRRQAILDGLSELRGKNLACWCKDEPCHASVLLEQFKVGQRVSIRGYHGRGKIINKHGVYKGNIPVWRIQWDSGNLSMEVETALEVVEEVTPAPMPVAQPQSPGGRWAEKAVKTKLFPANHHALERCVLARIDDAESILTLKSSELSNLSAEGMTCQVRYGLAPWFDAAHAEGKAEAFGEAADAVRKYFGYSTAVETDIRNMKNGEPK